MLQFLYFVSCGAVCSRLQGCYIVVWMLFFLTFESISALHFRSQTVRE